MPQWVDPVVEHWLEQYVAQWVDPVVEHWLEQYMAQWVDPVVEHCLEHINGLMGKPSCGTLAGTIHASMG